MEPQNPAGVIQLLRPGWLHQLLYPPLMGEQLIGVTQGPHTLFMPPKPDGTSDVKQPPGPIEVTQQFGLPTPGHPKHIANGLEN
jgi:hypothetical protein